MKYPQIVKALDRTLYLIGKQGIFHWGIQYTAAISDTLWNPGNFLEIIWQITHCYLLPYEHIHSPLRKDVSYMSPKSLNELIGITAKYIMISSSWYHHHDIIHHIYIYIYIYIYVCMYTYNAKRESTVSFLAQLVSGILRILSSKWL